MANFLDIRLGLLIVLTVLHRTQCTVEIGPTYFLISVKTDIYITPILHWEDNDLEPYIDEATIKAHYWGHHFAYRGKLNKVLAEWREEEPDNELAKESILEIMRNLEKVPEKYRINIRNNGGGFVNHCFYWSSLVPAENVTQKEPEGDLKADIERDFGSFEAFKEKFSEAAQTLFGSGYVWLSRLPASKGSKLVMHTTFNQDCPLSDDMYPILVIDVWEHAYYLKHQHRRVDYIPAWWKVVDWANVDKLDNWWREIYPGFMTKKDEL